MPCIKFLAILLVSLGVASLISGCDLARPKLHYGNGCKRCHGDVVLEDHDYPCVSCHSGDASAVTKKGAHRGLLKSPSSPEGARYACIKCHEKEVAQVEQSLHYTLRGEVETIWKAFFPNEVPPRSIADVPVETPLVTLRGLVADLLRRRCARCHVFSRGDGYPATQRRLGCGACHLRPGPRQMAHRFLKEVPDKNCLACHHGNFVGWDYVGRFQKDLEGSFQVPYYGGKAQDRPYGVEWLRMSSDIHMRLGYRCTDCHREGPCQERGESKVVACKTCHPKLSPSIPGHRPGDEGRVACGVCHALWSFNDRGRTLVRQDIANYWAWYDLRFQGIREIEQLLASNYTVDYFYWLPPVMKDPYSGEVREGVWYETFLERRFWPVQIGVDESGSLSVVRPILDLSIDYVDSDGEVVVESLVPQIKDLYMSYTPHTIGKADIYRTIRVMEYLEGVRDGNEWR